MFDVKEVIDFFLSKASMSHKKLQKLLYYAYCWVLALMNESADNINLRLFNERIEAWIHGPVIPKVYSEYKHYGAENINQIEKFNEKVFPEDVLDILNQVWDVYGKFTGNELEAISHRETPYIVARNGIPAYAASNNRISDDIIFKYFNEQSEK